jgi:stage V sporulation protein G
MEITEVKVSPIRKSNDKLKAFVTIVLDGCFIIRDLKVIHGNTGLFVAMPSRKRADGTYVDIAHPLDSKTRQWIEQAVLEEYARVVGESQKGEMTGEVSTE